MRVVILEDDNGQAKAIRMAIEGAFPGAKVLIMSSESSFRDEVPAIVADPPDLLILDVMARWTTPDDMREATADVVAGGYHEAGLRCVKRLHDHASEQEREAFLPPILFYTILSQQDLRNASISTPSGTELLTKQPEIAPLIERVRHMTGR